MTVSSPDDELPPEPAQAALGVGDVIDGKYELLRLLHEGGMGSVWEARHLMLDVPVAIKLIRSDIGAYRLSERFSAEARMAAHLTHPAIVSVFDLGVAEHDKPFIAMELLEGEDLRDVLLREKKLGRCRTVQLLLPIAEALAVVHEHGVIHRDVKPENVFIAKIGERLQPKIVDFGIACPIGASERTLTQGDTIVGSPDYMAPEQACALELDERADVWSFSAVLYECLTGRTPLAGTSVTTPDDVVSKPILPITALGVDDAQLNDIVCRGLERDRTARWQNMRALGSALAQWLVAAWIDEDASGQSLRATWLKDSDSPMFDSNAELDWAREPVRSVTVSVPPTAWDRASAVPVHMRGKHGSLRLALVAASLLLVASSAFALRTSSAETPNLASATTIHEWLRHSGKSATYSPAGGAAHQASTLPSSCGSSAVARSSNESSGAPPPSNEPSATTSRRDISGAKVAAAVRSRRPATSQMKASVPHAAASAAFAFTTPSVLSETVPRGQTLASGGRVDSGKRPSLSVQPSTKRHSERYGRWGF